MTSPLTVEDHQKFLRLHDKHMAAYVLQEGIPAAIRDKYIAENAALRADIERELKRMLS